MKAGFIGLGAMGAPMAGHVAARGLLAVVGNRTRAKADALAAQLGVKASASAADFAGCDVVALCVSMDADVLQQVEALAGVLAPGAVVVDHSTVSVDTARRAQALLAERGIGFLDAPVSGGVEGARNGKLSVMVGGAAGHLEKARPVLEAYAARITHMGDSGAGQATKAVNQIMVAGINQAVTEALAFGQAMGLDLDETIDVVGNGAAGNWFVNHRGPTMIRDVFRPGFRLALHHKDLAICQAMAAELNVALPVVEMTMHHYRRLMDEGYGDEDISALFRLKRELFAKGNKKSL